MKQPKPPSLTKRLYDITQRMDEVSKFLNEWLKSPYIEPLHYSDLFIIKKSKENCIHPYLKHKNYATADQVKMYEKSLNKQLRAFKKISPYLDKNINLKKFYKDQLDIFSTIVERLIIKEN